ncbi:hypothetical protein NPIL_570611 [Nephila pilipes]|uniref:Uncharacterized protein n=1 Tax=Nephila pilipes TaxID=299642 RepID=A0A8X6TKI1_NEPPI|nr:hypothetical protein NPIL_570611 [Nephila pilipes]
MNPFVLNESIEEPVQKFLKIPIATNRTVDHRRSYKIVGPLKEFIKLPIKIVLSHVIEVPEKIILKIYIDTKRTMGPLLPLQNSGPLRESIKVPAKNSANSTQGRGISQYTLSGQIDRRVISKSRKRNLERYNDWNDVSSCILYVTGMTTKPKITDSRPQK